MPILDQLQNAGSQAVDAVKGSDSLKAILAAAGASGLAGGVLTAGSEKRHDESPWQRRMRILRNAILAAGAGGGATALLQQGYGHLARPLPLDDKDPVAESWHHISHGAAPRVAATALTSLYPIRAGMAERETAKAKLSQMFGKSPEAMNALERTLGEQGIPPTSFLPDAALRHEGVNNIHGLFHTLQGYDKTTGNALQNPMVDALTAAVPKGLGTDADDIRKALLEGGMTNATPRSLLARIPGIGGLLSGAVPNVVNRSGLGREVAQGADRLHGNLMGGESNLVRNDARFLPRGARLAALAASVFAPELIGKGLDIAGDATRNAVSDPSQPAQ